MVISNFRLSRLYPKAILDLQWSNNSSIRFKRLLLSPVSSCCSRQTQGVVGAALNRRRELQVRCTASASCSSAEAASSVLSTSPESWIARVGRANSSTRQCERTYSRPRFQNFTSIFVSFSACEENCSQCDQSQCFECANVAESVLFPRGPKCHSESRGFIHRAVLSLA